MIWNLILIIQYVLIIWIFIDIYLFNMYILLKLNIYNDLIKFNI